MPRGRGRLDGRPSRLACLASRMATLATFTVAAISTSGTQNGQHTDVLKIEREIRECPNADSGAAELLVVQPCCQENSVQPCILALTDAVSGASGPSSSVRPVDHMCSQVSASDRVVARTRRSDLARPLRGRVSQAGSVGCGNGASVTVSRAPTKTGLALPHH